MFKKSFFGLSESCFYYESLSAPTPKRVKIPDSKNVTLHIKEPLSKKLSGGVKIGDVVKTGQKISLGEKNSTYAISSITGTVKAILPITSNQGSAYTSVLVEANNSDEIDSTFEKISSTPSLKILANFLATCPGEPPVWCLLRKSTPVKTILIYGGNSDLLVHNNLRIMLDKSDSINNGVKLLRNVTKIDDITVVVPEGTVQNYSGHLNANVKTVSACYPHAQPLMIHYETTGRMPGPSGLNSTDVCFFKLESIAAIGQAFATGKLPIEKDIAIIDKNGTRHLITVRIGTHIGHIFKVLNIEINDKDKIIFGGPMTGDAVSSEDYPILPDTDLILIQGKDEITQYSDYPCINCGECIRVCPANVPINLLVRFLEAGQYEEGADLYDLYSCVECGLCSYVCVSKIPIFQYIKLAKYELGRTGYAEEMNE